MTPEAVDARDFPQLSPEAKRHALAWETLVRLDLIDPEQRIETAQITAETRDVLEATLASRVDRTPESAVDPVQRAAWEEIITTPETFAAAAINKGRALGIEQNCMRPYIAAFLAEQLKRGNYIVMDRFLRGVKIGTSEQLESIRLAAEDQARERDLEEARLLEQNAGDSVRLRLDPAATMRDLFHAYEGLPSRAQRGVMDLRFQGLGDLYAELCALRQDHSAAEKITVATFFAAVPDFEKRIGIEWDIDED